MEMILLDEEDIWIHSDLNNLFMIQSYPQIEFTGKL